MWGHKKEEMLVTSIFSFYHNVFYFSETNFHFTSSATDLKMDLLKFCPSVKSQPFRKRQISDSSKLKEAADHIF